MLLEFSAGGHGPDAFDGVTAHAVKLLMEIDGNADVIGDDAKAVADGELALDAADIDEAMLLVHFSEDGLGSIDEVAEADFGGVGEAIRGESLGAAVDDDLAGAGGGDDGGEDGGGTIFAGTCAHVPSVLVVEDVGAGADFGHAFDAVGLEEQWRGTSADDVEDRKSTRLNSSH